MKSISRIEKKITQSRFSNYFSLLASYAVIKNASKTSVLVWTLRIIELYFQMNIFFKFLSILILISFFL